MCPITLQLLLVKASVCVWGGCMHECGFFFLVIGLNINHMVLSFLIMVFSLLSSKCLIFCIDLNVSISALTLPFTYLSISISHIFLYCFGIVFVCELPNFQICFQLHSLILTSSILSFCVGF